MKRRKLNHESILCVVVLVVLCIICIIPLWMVVVASLTDETELQRNGYKLFITSPTLSTYKFLIANKGKMLLRAFRTTLLTTVLGTVWSVTVTTLFAYAISQKKEEFRFARALSFFAWFTTIFSGGTLPWYIACTQMYGLKDNLFALFIPYSMSVWNMFILRGNFRAVPYDLIEAAKLDGSSNAGIFFRVSVPLAKSGIVTISLFNMLTFWNDFYLPQWLIHTNDYQTLQKMLYNMLSNSLALLKDSELSSVFDKIVLPTTAAKMAIAVMAILPIIILYPFSLRYFVKGINMGGIKG